MDTQPPTILSDIESYSQSDTIDFIYMLKETLSKQEELNNILNSKKYLEKTEQITNFVRQNDAEVDAQLTVVSDLVIKLKTVSSDNDRLLENEKQHIELLDSDISIIMSEKLIKIRSLKSEILSFLSKQGIMV